MTVKLDFEECLKDSPRFRAAIETVESDVTELEAKLDKLVKQCNTMLESGRVYCQNSRQFVAGVRELGQHSRGDDMMRECLDKFSSKLNVMIEAQGELIETTQKSVKQQIQNFVKEDVKRFKDTKKEFDKSSENLENSLIRNAQAPRNKQHEVDEASSALLTARRAFRNEALDYVLQITVIESKKKTEVLSSMLSLVEAQATFFAQGYDCFKELEEYRKDLAGQLHHLVLNCARDKRDMEQRHVTVKQKDISYDDSMTEFNPDARNSVAMEGYLYKRASNAFKTWSRRWFSIQNNQLVYQKKLKDAVTVVVEDVRLCTVKQCPDNERRFCFEVVSPSKSCLLQADSERQQQAWILAVQNSIATAFQEHREDSTGSRLERTASVSGGGGAGLEFPGQTRESVDKQALEQVQRIRGNDQCCDCGEPNPDWASINLGITLCIVCSGIHRSLGVHFSKVRSLTLDSWEPELMKLMCELGNSTMNGIYEARIDEMTIKKPHSGSPRQEKEAWIRSKYVEKKFIQKLPETGRPLRRSSARRNRANTQERPSARPPLKPKPGRATLPRLAGLPSSSSASSLSLSRSSPASPRDGEEDPVEDRADREDDLSALHPGALLFRAAALQNFPVMADALAHGADVNWVNAAEENSSPLIQAVSANSLVACEFLLQNGANVNQTDARGRGPIHHATTLGHTGLVCLFLKRGADQSARDGDGKDPLTIAIDNANADIVTLLRLAKMKEEMMREMEGSYGQSGDETYQDIFRDFSQMASNNPEKLNRRSADLKTSTL
ncbi:arf-GAP with coiled-coil, ANK repeat and PH domain-containing protein 1 isoform X2 [Polyodon spathula]|uniref:arf-GAP with coiled-coil, ANK repeat and PH domain-containing protein 1 isoform X2 n=1 Tax=Polyodon spathula TaxID=7913 RepID=UPI001B7E1654|nr:arf-GAP with coiled-coil, ANK repeat and PH domain-containing protein 1 isoform X2 [Polyodon spathula]